MSPTETIARQIEFRESIPAALKLYDEISQDCVLIFREVASVASAALSIATRQAEVSVMGPGERLCYQKQHHYSYYD